MLRIRAGHCLARIRNLSSERGLVALVLAGPRVGGRGDLGAVGSLDLRDLGRGVAQARPDLVGGLPSSYLASWPFRASVRSSNALSILPAWAARKILMMISLQSDAAGRCRLPPCWSCPVSQEA